ncbi:MAG: DUF3786 domain-containing protein [Lachnospiraceae bacterium]|nr:DUF3786 domain-containing protein [Lachnospiraceae bacterium]
MESNYEKQVIAARALFLNFSQEKMIQKFSLQWDEQYLYLPFFHWNCRIDRASGRITLNTVSGSVDGDYEQVMTIYDYLCHPGELPSLSGEWCPLQSLQRTLSSPSPDRLFGDYVGHFSGAVDRLWQACEAVGGVRISTARSADVSVRFQIFPQLPLVFQFWDGDEEFEPRIMLLWDRNSLKFLNFETLYYVVRILLELLLTCQGI